MTVHLIENYGITVTVHLIGITVTELLITVTVHLIALPRFRAALGRNELASGLAFDLGQERRIAPGTADGLVVTHHSFAGTVI